MKIFIKIFPQKQSSSSKCGLCYPLRSIQVYIVNHRDTLTHDIITTTIPPNLGGDFLEPPKNVAITFVQPIIPYSKPSRRPLNYLEYKKGFDLDAHVRVFETTIKANGETINEEIKNLFNFTLKENASNWCNNYMIDHPNCRFTNLE